MKYIKNTILVFSMIAFAACGETKKEDNDANLILLKLVTSTSGNKSIVYIEQSDPFTYNGYCLDNFSPLTGYMTVDDYYAANAVPSVSMGIYQKNKLSKKSCHDLGFSSGTPMKEGNGISFDKAICGPQASHCNDKAIKEAGFTI